MAKKLTGMLKKEIILKLIYQGQAAKKVRDMIGF